MPNNGRITKCPFYRDEKNLSISCEDTFHRFRWPAQKKRHMDSFCDADWQKCPYSMALLRVYQNGGDMDETLELKNRVAALRKELRKTATMLGKAEKREKSKDEQIRELQNANRALEQIHMRDKDEIAKLLSKYEKLSKDLFDMTHHYEGRFAYLISEFASGYLNEIDFLEWAKENEFKIEPDIQAEFEGRKVTSGWKVEVRRVESEHGAEGLARENENTGGSKNHRSDEEKR